MKTNLNHVLVILELAFFTILECVVTFLKFNSLIYNYFLIKLINKNYEN